MGDPHGSDSATKGNKTSSGDYETALSAFERSYREYVAEKKGKGVGGEGTVKQQVIGLGRKKGEGVTERKGGKDREMGLWMVGEMEQKRKQWEKGSVQTSFLGVRLEAVHERLSFVGKELGLMFTKVNMTPKEENGIMEKVTAWLVDGMEALEGVRTAVYSLEANTKKIGTDAADIVARLKEQSEKKDREILQLKEYIGKMGKGVACSPRPETAEGGTSPQRDSQDGLRTIVRDLIREELDGRNKGEDMGRGLQQRQGEGVAAVSGMERVSVVPAVIAVRGGGSRTYADVLGVLRKEVPREALGAEKVEVRVTPSGVARITLAGADRDTARRVAATFREVLGDVATVTCPCPMETIEVAGFDLSVRESELAAEIRRGWQVSAADLWVGKVCRTRGGAGRTLVRLPQAAARHIRREGLRVGWCRARAYALEPRMVQCFRCLGFGHSQGRCVASVVALEHPACYVCAKPGHLASRCNAIAPSCAACGLRGWDISHRMGSSRCLTLAAYTSRQGPRGVEEKGPVRGTGVAEKRPTEPRKRQREEMAPSLVEGSSIETTPMKTIAITPPVGGPESGLPPEGLDPGIGVEPMEEC